MITSEIITNFELFVDDTTELSAQEELSLANKIYRRVLNYRPWEFLKKEATGTLSTSVAYVSLPADFAYMAENNQYTNNSAAIDNNASPKVVFVGTNYNPYQIINFSDRRQYRNQAGYAYIDIVNSRLVFTAQPTAAESYEFDYIHNPADLTTATSPIFPSRFHEIIYHGMASEDYIIQQFDKAKSYVVENQNKYLDYLRDMSYWNSQLINN